MIPTGLFARFQSIDQGPEFLGAHHQTGLLDLWPGETTLLKSFRANPEARAILNRNFKPVAQSVGEDTQMSGQWILDLSGGGMPTGRRPLIGDPVICTTP